MGDQRRFGNGSAVLTDEIFGPARKELIPIETYPTARCFKQRDSGLERGGFKVVQDFLRNRRGNLVLNDPMLKYPSVRSLQLSAMLYHSETLRKHAEWSPSHFSAASIVSAKSSTG